MLILTRRTGEQILIDKGQIEIKILYIRRGRVALGIQAPHDIDVDRKEIFLKKRESLEQLAKQPIVTEQN
ncbi:carbon storage regulator [Legionella sp. CNM-1927-20]|uniref:carbon storage regulator n=1 Tax=Legionella sp. CNM-1927-20 TaxID=3422221 RepID=UPI00403B0A81